MKSQSDLLVAVPFARDPMSQIDLSSGHVAAISAMKEVISGVIEAAAL